MNWWINWFITRSIEQSQPKWWIHFLFSRVFFFRRKKSIFDLLVFCSLSCETCVADNNLKKHFYENFCWCALSPILLTRFQGNQWWSIDKKPFGSRFLKNRREGKKKKKTRKAIPKFFALQENVIMQKYSNNNSNNNNNNSNNIPRFLKHSLL